MALTSSEAGVAVSLPYVRDQLGHDIELPSEVGGFEEVRTRSKSKSREKHRQIREIYNVMREIVMDWDRIMDDIIGELNEGQIDLPYENVGEKLSELNEERRRAEEILSIKRDETLKNHPSIAFDLLNHNKLAKIYFEILGELDEEVGLDNLMEEFSGEIEKEEFSVGAFLGLEPYLVVAVFYADKIDDEEFLDSYQELFDRISFRFSRDYESEFEEATEYDRLKVSQAEAQDMVENEGSQRMLQL